MTQIKVDNVVDAAGTAAADFTSGLTVAGAALSTLNTAEYYETGTEPTSPKNGAIWKDTANDKVMVYIADEFKEVELGAAAAASWTVDLSNMTYDSVSFSVTSQESGPLAIAFNTDGTKMYITGYVNDSIYQYSLSTGFDVSTASYDNVSFSVAGQIAAPGGIIFNSDGTKVYITSGDDRVYQYSMSTAFDTSTISYDNYSFSVNQDSGAHSIRFSTDGTKMYMIGLSGDAVYQYSLSTAFDISTASYDSVSFSVVSQDNQPRSLIFNTDGTQMFIFGSQTNNIYQYSLSTGFDLSTASYASKSFSSSSQNTDAGGLISNTDGTKFFTIDAGTDRVYQYSTGL